MGDKSHFDIFDSDGDGCISTKEIAYALYAYGCNPTVKEAEALAAQANPSDPEHITWQQFQGILGKDEEGRQTGTDRHAQRERSCQVESEISDLRETPHPPDQHTREQQRSQHTQHTIACEIHGRQVCDKLPCVCVSLTFRCRRLSPSLPSAHAPRPDRSAEQHMLEAFRVFDKNEDGKIPENDIRVIFTTLGEQVDVFDLNELLKQVQVDQNGKVAYADFVKLILKQ